MDDIERVPALVREIYRIIAELEALFPGRKFTMDGHLLGSVGEVVAAQRYNLRLLTASAEGHDAIAPGGRRVQIKATQGNSIAMRSEPEHLLVLRLLIDGSAEEVFNGPGAPAWHSAGKMQKNGQRQVSLSRLLTLMETIDPAHRIPTRQG